MRIKNYSCLGHGFLILCFAFVFCIGFAIAGEGNVCLPSEISIEQEDETSNKLVIPKFKQDGNILVFLDASSNMRGFVADQSEMSLESTSNYARMVGVIPTISPLVGKKVKYHKYRNGDFYSLSVNQVTRATRKTFYKCPPDIAKNECDRPSFQIPKWTVLSH